VELDDMQRSVLPLNYSQRQARLLGNGVDAAIDDPRWRAADKVS